MHHFAGFAKSSLTAAKIHTQTDSDSLKLIKFRLKSFLLWSLKVDWHNLLPPSAASCWETDGPLWCCLKRIGHKLCYWWMKNCPFWNPGSVSCWLRFPWRRPTHRPTQSHTVSQSPWWTLKPLCRLNDLSPAWRLSICSFEMRYK